MKIVLVPCLCMGLLFPLLGWAGLAGDIEKAIEEIAEAIAEESGRPAANFMGYATRLVQTLGRLSPEAQERVLGDEADVLPYDATDGVIYGDRDGTTTDPGDGSTTDPTNTPADDPEVDGPLKGLINQEPPLADSELRDMLVEASPISGAVMNALLDREPAMGSNSLLEVLVENLPLPSDIYAQVEAGETNLSASARLQVLDAHYAAMSGFTAP